MDNAREQPCYYFCSQNSPKFLHFCIIISDKTPNDLIEMLRGCDIPNSQIAILARLEEFVNSEYMLLPVERQQLLLNILATGINVEHSFGQLCEILFHSNKFVLPTQQDAASPPMKSPPSSEPEAPHPLQCKLCCTRIIDVVFIPCGHAMACEECADRTRRCPICRGESRLLYRKIYFS